MLAILTVGATGASSGVVTSNRSAHLFVFGDDGLIVRWIAYADAAQAREVAGLPPD